MTAGLPGVGIGGMFYLASALLMPFRSLHAALTGREPRWGVALRQAALAAGALGAVWATGWLVGWMMTEFTTAPLVGPTGAPGVAPPVQNAVRTAALLGSVLTLFVVLSIVQAMRVLMPPRPTPRVPRAAAADEAQTAA